MFSWKLRASATMLAIVAGGMLVGAQNTRWATPAVAVAHVRETPGHASELGTQMLMGMPLQVHSIRNGWAKITGPNGYNGYIIENSLQYLTEDDLKEWRLDPKVVVTDPDIAFVYSTPEKSKWNRVTDIVCGDILVVTHAEGLGSEWLKVRLPDGREGFVETASTEPFDKWKKQKFSAPEMIALAKTMMGTTYLWGGASTKGVDCSGLTCVAFLGEGIMLPRNASAQACIGVPVPLPDYTVGYSGSDLLLPGDLLFFGNADTGRINHVGIYLGNDMFIHSSGRVKINSLNPSDDCYAGLSLISIRRLTADDLEQLSVKNNPWY